MERQRHPGMMMPACSAVPGFRFAQSGLQATRSNLSIVMPGLVPGIHVFLFWPQ
jgi:hypothetical protein